MTITSSIEDTAPDDATRAVGSWDEFTQLREVVVGTAKGARLPSSRTDRSAWLNLYPELAEFELGSAPEGPFPDAVIEEAEEDLAALVGTLEDLGVVVHRAAAMDHDAEFDAGLWRSKGMYSYCPRDLTLVLGETLIDCPSPTRARYFESRSISHILDGATQRGAFQLAAPRPRLTDDLYSVGPDGRPRLEETEPVFEAANVLRCGADILYQVSTSGNEAGLRWLRQAAQLLGLRVHPIRGVYKYTHIDSTIAILRPGLVLLNPGRIHPTQVPDIFRGWKIIWCPEPAPQSSGRFDLSSKWIGMNLLSVSPDAVIVDANQGLLIRELERHGITAIPQQMRHQRALGGGVHCVTLDLRRDGGRVSYRRSGS